MSVGLPILIVAFWWFAVSEPDVTQRISNARYAFAVLLKIWKHSYLNVNIMLGLCHATLLSVLLGNIIWIVSKAEKDVLSEEC